MKFKFNLEKVLKHRKIQEDLAQRDYQEALAELHNQERKLEKILNSIVESRELISWLEVQVAPDRFDRVNQAHQFIYLQGLRADRQKEKIKEVEKLVESKQELLRQKAMDKKIIERLKDKKRKAFEVEQNKVQQKELDEIVSMRTRFVKEVEEK